MCHSYQPKFSFDFGLAPEMEPAEALVHLDIPKTAFYFYASLPFEQISFLAFLVLPGLLFIVLQRGGDLDRPIGH